jgi:hypothetical protein
MAAAHEVARHLAGISGKQWTVVFQGIQAFAIFVTAAWILYRVWKERTDTPHIEFTIQCRCFDAKGENYIVEFLIGAENKGHVIQRFHNIKLRVKGIEEGAPLQYWKGHGYRLDFPKRVFNQEDPKTHEVHKVAELVLKKWDYIFVEPGVNQQLTYVTMVPKTFKFILAQAKFWYDQSAPHNEHAPDSEPAEQDEFDTEAKSGELDESYQNDEFDTHTVERVFVLSGSEQSSPSPAPSTPCCE